MQIEPLPACLGAEIRGLDLHAALPEDEMRMLRQAYLDHLVLVIRDQQIGDIDLVRLARGFGELMMPPARHERASVQESDAPPEITVVSNVKRNGVPIGELGDGEVVWHSDYSFRDVPGGMRILHGVQIPPPEAGGNTLFANMYAAFDDLPDDLRQIALTSAIKHDVAYDTNRSLRMGARPPEDLASGPGPVHPVVSTHPETGCNALFLGRRMAHYVMGRSVRESEEILDALWEHATRDAYTLEHQWRHGDIVMWDNRCTLHKRGPFRSDVDRILHAAQVVGHRPFMAIDAARRLPHPRARLATAH